MVFTLYWTHANGQSFLDLGTYPTREAAEAAKNDRLAEMIAAGTKDDENWIAAGTLTIDEEDDD